MSDLHEHHVISAAFDGERVDMAALRAALADDEGRAALASFLLMRAALRADDAEPDTATALRRPDRASWAPRGWRVAAGAAAAGLLLASGFWAGGAWTARFQPSPRPAAPVVAPAGDRPPAGGTGPSREAPRPTRVLQFTPGVDWHNRS